MLFVTETTLDQRENHSKRGRGESEVGGEVRDKEEGKKIPTTEIPRRGEREREGKRDFQSTSFIANPSSAEHRCAEKKKKTDQAIKPQLGLMKMGTARVNGKGTDEDSQG